MEAVIPYFGCMRFRYTPRRKKSKKNSANRQLSLLLEIKSALISVKFSSFGSQKTKRKLTRALMENPEGDSKLRKGTVHKGRKYFITICVSTVWILRSALLSQI